MGREAIVPWHHLAGCLPVRVLVAMDAGGQCSAVGWPLARRAEGGRETVAAGRQAAAVGGRGGRRVDQIKCGGAAGSEGSTGKQETQLLIHLLNY